MKKYQILSLYLCSTLAVLLTNCNKTNDPQPGAAHAKYTTTAHFNPAFHGKGAAANELDNLTGDFVRVSTYLTKPGSSKTLQHGHVWSEYTPSPYVSADPQQANFQTELGGIHDNEVFPYGFTSYVKNLTPGATYYIRAYVVNNEGTFYGPSTQFQTAAKGNIQ